MAAQLIRPQDMRRGEIHLNGSVGDNQGSEGSNNSNAIAPIIKDQLAPLYFRPNVTAASNRLVNWKPEYDSNGYTWNVWEWDLRE